MLDSDFLMKNNNNRKILWRLDCGFWMKWTQTSLLFWKSCGVIFLTGYFFIYLETKGWFWNHSFNITRRQMVRCRFGSLCVFNIGICLLTNTKKSTPPTHRENGLNVENIMNEKSLRYSPYKMCLETLSYLSSFRTFLLILFLW